MESPLNQDWLDEVTRRRLTAVEADRWRRELAGRRDSAGRPAEARRLDEELALNDLLDAMPRPVASSNFATRVLAEIDQLPGQESALARVWSITSGLGIRIVSWPFRPFRSASWASVTASLVGLVALAASLSWGWERARVHRHGAMARTAAELSVAAAMPGVAILQDFEAVQLLETRSAPDDVALLQALREDSP